MSLVEKRYAEALIGLAKQQDAFEALGRELKLIVEALERDPEFWIFLQNPHAGQKERKNAVKAVFASAFLPELVNFMLLLIDKDRIKELPGIRKQYEILADNHSNILNITIVSAFPLSNLQVDKIKQKYVKLYNAADAKALIKLEEGLLGGIKVMIGDKVIDGSVKGRLDSLKESLKFDDRGVGCYESQT